MTIYIKNVRRNHRLPGRHVPCQPNEPTDFVDIQEPIYVLYVYWTCRGRWPRMGEYSKNDFFFFLISTSQAPLGAFYLLISCTGSAAAAAAGI